MLFFDKKYIKSDNFFYLRRQMVDDQVLETREEEFAYNTPIKRLRNMKCWKNDDFFIIYSNTFRIFIKFYLHIPPNSTSWCRTSDQRPSDAANERKYLNNYHRFAQLALFNNYCYFPFPRATIFFAHTNKKRQKPAIAKFSKIKNPVFLSKQLGVVNT